MGDISLFRAELTSLLIESLLFGCFCVLYLVSLWILVFRRHTRGPSDSMGKWLLAVVTVMLVLSMTHLMIIGENIIWSFSDYDGPGGVSAALLSPRRGTTLIASMAITAVLTLVGDSFMVYRIFVVWDRAWLPIVLPSACMFGTVAGAAACAYEFYHARLGITQAMYSEQRMYVTLATFLACSLAANLVILALLVGRILWYDREIRRFRIEDRRSLPRRVAWTIVQSEATHSAVVLMNMASYAARSHFGVITSNALPPLIGISFTLIITHVGLCEMTDDARDADEHALYVDTDMVFSFNAGIGSRRASVRVERLTAASSSLSRDNAFDLDTLRCRPGGLDSDSGSRSKMPEYVGAA